MADAHQRAEDRLHTHAKRIIPPGSFIVPLDVTFALGASNGEIGESIIAKMFRLGRYNANMPRVLPPEAVREIGHGNIAAGRKVLQKFVANLRARQETGTGKETAEPQTDDTDGGKAGYFYERVPLAKIIPQPDGNHGRRYAKAGAVGKMTKQTANYRPGFEENKFCALCSMFAEPSGCSLVQGKISRTALCDYFEREKADAAE